MKIREVEIKGHTALAPMAGVTDLAFRTVCRELGASYTYTEMVSAKALMYQDKKSRALLKLGEGERPAAAQIFGSEPSVMAEGAAKAIDISGADVLDINMGCPTGKIVRNGEGAALMQEPELAMRIIESVVSAVTVPVTVKIRKGWDKGSINAVEFAKMAEAAGACAIAVHGRTRSQLYSGIADWDIIAEVKRAVNIPVIANGDVFTPEDAVKILKRTGADLVMIGRGSLGNPWLFSGAEAAVRGEEIPAVPPLARRCDTAVRQFELAKEDRGEKIACLEARKHYSWYLHGVPYSGYFKEQISKIETMDDIYRITEGIKRELR
ncbi:MAG: tRNA dihydrouridine synthase DusB [Clostridiales bacterium]|nr:tRNA dihydrouridine synthase DusB [Clostridiales bacterium]